MIKKFITKMEGLLNSPSLKPLDSLWFDAIRQEQKEYEKDKILLPNDGSDWRREKI